MKNPFFKRTPIKTALVFLFILLNGCGTSSIITEKNDIVYSTKRIELKLAYQNFDRRSPLLNLNQTIIKEIAEDNTTSIKIYDVLILTSSSFALDNKVFLIVGNETFPMTIDTKEREDAKETNIKKEEIMKADSTKVTVVTGYSESNTKITRFSYRLSDAVIMKIKNTDRVLFRYYSGPDMITVTLQGWKLDRMKRLLEKT